MQRLKMSFFYQFLDSRVIPYVFSFSKQPMLFRELLIANKMFNDGIKLEDHMAGFKINLMKLYIIFLLLWHITILPILIIFHFILISTEIKVDCHLSIILAVVFTILFFSSFSIYKDYLVQRVATKLIKKGWKNHFPHFDFDKNSQNVSKIYSQAIEDGVQNRDLEQYVINSLIQK
jgi:hypothetical protein